jgi:hypothetical protein
VRKFVLLGALALVASAAPVLADPPIAQIPIAKFASLPTIRRPVLSPDGHRIAARSVADGKTTLLVLNADQPEAPAKGIPIGKMTVSDLDWAGNQRLLLQIRLTEKIPGGDEIPYLRLVAIDVETGVSRVLDRKSRGVYAGDVLYSDPSGSWALVASQDDIFSYPSVKRVDLATGNAKVVERAKDGVWSWYADDKGTVRAGIAYEGSGWTIWYRDKAEDKLRAVHGKFPKDDDTALSIASSFGAAIAGSLRTNGPVGSASTDMT